MSWPRLSLALALRSLRRPRLAISLIKVAWRFRQRGWHKRFPFLPLPDAQYVKWRMHTAYGDHYAVPRPDEVERYATWATRDDP